MKPRRAFVTPMAIMMIALVAVALGALTARLSTAARQARQSARQAQLEQLLRAGAAVSREGAQGERVIALPAALADDQATLKVSVRGNRIEIEAAVGRMRMREILQTDGAGAKVRLVE